MHGRSPDTETAAGPRLPQGVRGAPPVRPDRRGNREPFRDRGEERLLLPGASGTQGVHPAHAPPSAPDRVRGGEPRPVRRAHSGPGPSSRRGAARGDRGDRGGASPRSRPGGGGRGLLPARQGGQHDGGPHLRRGSRPRPVTGPRGGGRDRRRRDRRRGHRQAVPPMEREGAARGRQPGLSPHRRPRRRPLVPHRRKSRRRLPEIVGASRVPARHGARLLPLPFPASGEDGRDLRGRRVRARAPGAGRPASSRRGGGGRRRREPVRPVRDLQGGPGEGGGGGGGPAPHPRLPGVHLPPDGSAPVPPAARGALPVRRPARRRPRSSRNVRRRRRAVPGGVPRLPELSFRAADARPRGDADRPCRERGTAGFGPPSRRRARSCRPGGVLPLPRPNGRSRPYPATGGGRLDVGTAPSRGTSRRPAGGSLRRLPWGAASRGRILTMGRTVLPFTQELYREEESWRGFRRALRREDRELLDALFAAARYHTAACTCAERVVPFDAILMSILVEERRSVRELSRRIEELERRLASPPREGPDGR